MPVSVKVGEGGLRVSATEVEEARVGRHVRETSAVVPVEAVLTVDAEVEVAVAVAVRITGGDGIRGQAIERRIEGLGVALKSALLNVGTQVEEEAGGGRGIEAIAVDPGRDEVEIAVTVHVHERGADPDARRIA